MTTPPITSERADPFVADITQNGQQLVAEMGAAINRISIMRSMQIGYMLACQDNGLEVPEFEDPAKTLFGG